jgi:hypothetical protein
VLWPWAPPPHAPPAGGGEGREVAGQREAAGRRGPPTSSLWPRMPQGRMRPHGRWQQGASVRILVGLAAPTSSFCLQRVAPPPTTSAPPCTARPPPPRPAPPRGLLCSSSLSAGPASSSTESRRRVSSCNRQPPSCAPTTVVPRWIPPGAGLPKGGEEPRELRGNRFLHLPPPPPPDPSALESGFPRSSSTRTVF